MKEFTIDRSKWDRGKIFEDSRIDAGIDESTYLLHPYDGAMCCLGFYLKSCGVPAVYLRDQRGPKNAARPMLSRGRRIPMQMRWLLEDAGLFPTSSVVDDSELAQKLMNVNDNEDLPSREREKKIAALFAKQGIKVKFVGRSPRRSRRAR